MVDGGQGIPAFLNGHADQADADRHANQDTHTCIHTHTCCYIHPYTDTDSHV
jgi:hypothetical protein